MTISPYAKPGFYDDALSKGRHRDIVGGRWGETADIMMPLLMELGLRDSDKVLDIALERSTVPLTDEEVAAAVAAAAGAAAQASGSVKH